MRAEAFLNGSVVKRCEKMLKIGIKTPPESLRGMLQLSLQYFYYVRVPFGISYTNILNAHLRLYPKSESFYFISFPPFHVGHMIDGLQYIKTEQP